jgi:NAD(P)-dependent dehydrogenase (short-subunit alcohol dehydrogenase family)
MSKSSESELRGKTALVTGSTDGIGVAIAQTLAHAGARVVVTGRNLERGNRVAESIVARGGTAWFVPADLELGLESVQALVCTATAISDSPIHILVNNAAMLVAPASTSDIDEDTINRALAVSVKAPFLLTGLIAPLMAANGGGSIVNVGSFNALRGSDGLALYSATKAAVHSLTTSWAAEYGPRGVRVNAVAPGATLTEKVAAMQDLLAPVLAALPSRRANELDDVAQAALFLVSDRAANIHGVILSVDGGAAAV